MCFVFVLEIYGNTPLGKSNHQRAQESTVAWSTEGKPNRKTFHFQTLACPQLPGSQLTLSVQILEQVSISDALPMTRSPCKAHLNCAQQGAEASSAEGTDRPLLP